VKNHLDTKLDTLSMLPFAAITMLCSMLGILQQPEQNYTRDQAEYEWASQQAKRDSQRIVFEYAHDCNEGNEPGYSANHVSHNPPNCSIGVTLEYGPLG
jgi:hypothetical protein